MDEKERERIINRSPLKANYDQTLNRESAYEMVINREEELAKRRQLLAEEESREKEESKKTAAAAAASGRVSWRPSPNPLPGRRFQAGPTDHPRHPWQHHRQALEIPVWIKSLIVISTARLNGCRRPEPRERSHATEHCITRFLPLAGITEW
ncbi:MAG: DUF853 family protein [gamma proteobacterium endosymbiont of Lamellibrachia anaximandri]|nr:DUF853 family protein [gamma proteobacterium endosymbiont of Lamellibrachia anaximandri]MBL3619387.1 DUF853 family protein [gamma proteobacterium endosymbiont of Lamellibrachia anaximandri]